MRIGFGSFDDDFPGSPLPQDTQLTVNGGQAPTDGSWFQMSPDGTTIAVLSTGGTGGNNGDLSAYAEGLVGGVPTLGAETTLDTANLGTGFGVSNDDRVSRTVRLPGLASAFGFARAQLLRVRAGAGGRVLLAVPGGRRHERVFAGQCGTSRVGGAVAENHSPRRALRRLPYAAPRPRTGPLLAIVALGLIAYGVYSFVEARYRRVGRA